jgi:alcohol dehydrogenase class IV
VDPDLTLTVPPAVTAATGVDALAHCAEAFTSRKAHPLIDLYALEGIRLVGRFPRPRRRRRRRPRGARRAFAGLALRRLLPRPGEHHGGHAVAYPLGTRHHIAHGLSCAVVFPHTLAFNAPAAPEKTALVLDALGLGAAKQEDAVREAAHGFCARLGIEMRLSRLGVPEADLPAMAEEAHAIRRLLDNNPRDIGREQILAIYRAAH